MNGTLVKRWVWCDEAQPCEERDASNTVTKRFYAGLGFQSGGASFFYTQDHLGSTREVVDGSGAVRARYDYSPYGAVTKLSGDVDADFLYTGHYRHAATTLHLTLFRAYDSELGRWLSRDPIEEDGGINLYGYVANNPLAFVDPLGLREVEVYIWKGKGVSSAGHVMITERNQKRAILSQFPALRLLWSHNLPLTYDTTMKKEGRPEDYRFIVDIPDDKNFDDAVVAEWNRDEWNWNPNQKDQTQCSTAAWNAMAAGGMPFKPEKGTFRPSVMGKRLLEMSKQPNSRVRLLPK